MNSTSLFWINDAFLGGEHLKPDIVTHVFQKMHRLNVFFCLFYIDLVQTEIF